MISFDALPENYAFVMNVGALKGAATLSLPDGHELRRAKPEEIDAIREIVERVPFPLPPNPWEFALGSPAAPSRRLPPNEWRYFVVAFRGSNHAISELGHVFDLAAKELEIGFTILRHDPTGRLIKAVTAYEDRLFQMLNTAKWYPEFFVQVSLADTEDIALVYANLQRAGGSSRLGQLVQQFGQLKGLPHRSSLRFLGYFAILEAVLTHSPKPSDPYDSITRQVAKKLALLNNRWKRPIDYGRFGDSDPDTVWKKMYAYRSQVAHGSTADFKGGLSLLRSREDALNLVKETAKAVLRHALEEPQLLMDLREC